MEAKGHEMQDRIIPCLWFDTNAEEAVSFYTAVFPDSRVTATSRYGEGAPLPAGSVMSIDFELAGRPFMAINGGPMFEFSPAISLMFGCESQEEIDRLWRALGEDGGETQACGWLKDRFGVSWQIVPAALSRWMGGERSDRVMQALWGMTKLDVEALRRAAEG